jgi:hypothetical protein
VPQPADGSQTVYTENSLKAKVAASGKFDVSPCLLVRAGIQVGRVGCMSVRPHTAIVCACVCVLLLRSMLARWKYSC